MFDIEAELKKLPAKPGVYIMHDKDDKIIYVGKAISLKNRVRQYFRKNNKTKHSRTVYVFTHSCKNYFYTPFPVFYFSAEHQNCIYTHRYANKRKRWGTYDFIKWKVRYKSIYLNRQHWAYNNTCHIPPFFYVYKNSYKHKNHLNSKEKIPRFRIRQSFQRSE